MGPALYRVLNVAALALAVGVPSAASAQALILRSGGPSAGHYPPGTRTPPGATFNLRPGDSLSILASGSTRSFRGPGLFSASSPSGGGAAAVGARINTGAVRSGETRASTHVRTDIWQVDVTRSGRVCALPGRGLMLWRPMMAQAAQLTITPQVGAPRTIAWAAGADTLVWPTDLPAGPTATYQLSLASGAAPSRITLRSINVVDPANLEALAAAFTANHCDAQLDVLIALHADAPPAPRPASR